MGYRSDVRIATTKKGYEFLCERINEYVKAHPAVVKLLGTSVEPDFYEEFGDDVVFGWDCVKWDPSYSYVAPIEEAIGKLEREAGIPYEFCRVGELDADVEKRGTFGFGELGVHVSPYTTINIYQ